MNNNIRILLVNCNELEDVLQSLNFQQITKVKDGKTAIKEFVAEPFDVTFVHELPTEEEKALIESMLEMNPEHYIVNLTDTISPEKVMNSVRNGACGILSKPFTAHKIRLELDKFDLFAGDENRKVS